MTGARLGDRVSLHVVYPSGRTFTVEGRWEGPRILSETYNNPLHTEADGVAVVLDSGEWLILDPRAVITNTATGDVLYRPRWVS